MKVFTIGFNFDANQRTIYSATTFLTTDNRLLIAPIQGATIKVSDEAQD